MVKHELAASAYNLRRAACEAGVQVLKRSRPQISSLRDVSAAELELHQGQMPDEVYRRCRHVVTENVRVLDAAGALEREDLKRFGELMCASHRSLRDDYEVSCGELDLMAELAMSAEGVYGARMMGGGFGGCTVNLVKTQNVDSFIVSVGRGYERATGRKPEIYVCAAAQGAEQWAEQVSTATVATSVSSQALFNHLDPVATARVLTCLVDQASFIVATSYDGFSSQTTPHLAQSLTGNGCWCLRTELPDPGRDRLKNFQSTPYFLTMAVVTCAPEMKGQVVCVIRTTRALSFLRMTLRR
jgi:hypothetical protein